MELYIIIYSKATLLQKKRCGFIQNGQREKSEIQGGGLEMTVMV